MNRSVTTLLLTMGLAMSGAAYAGLGSSDDAIESDGILSGQLSLTNREEEASRLDAIASGDPQAILDNATPEELAELVPDTPNGEAAVFKGDTAKFTCRVDVNISSRPQQMTLRTASGSITKTISAGKEGRSDLLRGNCHTVDAQMPVAFSGKYANAKMPFATFFRGVSAKRKYVFALHGSDVVTGNPESKGCIRLRQADAKEIYEAIQRCGTSRTIVCVQ